MISLHQASVRFEAHNIVVDAIKRISLTINEGDWVSILGPSGSGKTTLLNVISGKQKITEGTIEVFGTDLSSLHEREGQLFKREMVGVIFQHYRLFDQFNVLENIMIPEIPYLPKRDLTKRAKLLAEQVGLGHRLYHLPGQLSGGEKQRTAIARALLNEPKILLCDEPTGNLDAVNREQVLKLFRSLNAKGITLVVVTHDEEVARCGNRSLFIKDGELEERVLA